MSQTIYTTKIGDFPLYCYDYPKDAKTTNEQSIEDEIELAIVFEDSIPKAIQENRRFVIVNDLGLCLFHVDNGQLQFPLRKHLKIKNGRWSKFNLHDMPKPNTPP